MGGGVEPLAQFPGGLLGEGAERQLGGIDRALQQQVDGAPDHGAGFAGAGAGDDQQRSPQVAHHGPLLVIQLRLKAVDNG